MNDSDVVQLLHRSVQKWIWDQGWNQLREVQEKAIKPILDHSKDVIISAATASGKTEAAFLPACTYIKKEEKLGVRILYISPLKALINDQYRRLDGLCEKISVPLTPWHGDISQSLKLQNKNNPGILMITPESMEARLMKDCSWCKQQFDVLDYIIIDEFHCFLGSERGYQLLSQLERIEFLVGKKIPRIALSATFSEMDQVAECLRTEKGFPYEIVESTSQGTSIQLESRGYLRNKNPEQEEQDEGSYEYTDTEIPRELTIDIFKLMRQKSNLVFANSRRNVETIADRLAQYCQHNHVPEEFYPHHGNLSKEIREGLEERFQKGDKPTTAIATSTLELGVDIGSVDSVGQVGVSPSVSSMRQRLGRSGRRGNPAVFRLFTIEVANSSKMTDRLRIDTVQSAAMVKLMLDKWCEPPPEDQYQFSTLAQQTLSVIAQYGSVRADQLWQLLCKRGPFRLVNKETYAEFLKSLAENELIQQDNNGTIVIGSNGESIVNMWHFFAAFKTDEEYTVIHKGKKLGTIPTNNPLFKGDAIIFAGKRWLILDIHEDKKRIIVSKALTGNILRFGGDGFPLHGKIREEMYKIYSGRMDIDYLDKPSKRFLAEGIETFHELSLTEKRIISYKGYTYVILWCDDKVVHTLIALLKSECQDEQQKKTLPMEISNNRGIVCIGRSEGDVRKILTRVINKRKPTLEELSNQLVNCYDGKYDWTLSERLRRLGYAKKHFDIDMTWQKMQEIL